MEIAIDTELLEINKAYFNTWESLQKSLTEGLTPLQKVQRSNWLQTDAAVEDFRQQQLRPYQELLFHSKTIVNSFIMYLEQKEQYVWSERVQKSMSVVESAFSLYVIRKTLLASFKTARDNSALLTGKTDFISVMKHSYETLGRTAFVAKFGVPFLAGTAALVTLGCVLFLQSQEERRREN